jgi:hypothetical protein
MATSGEFADLFAREFDMARGQVHARGHELRADGVIPIGGHGTAAIHLSARPVTAWMLALGMDPPRLEVAKHVKAALKLQRIDIESNHVFADLSVSKCERYVMKAGNWHSKSPARWHARSVDSEFSATIRAFSNSLGTFSAAPRRAIRSQASGESSRKK